MPALRSLLATHAPLLWIDAASSRVQAGWLEGESAMSWEASEDEAGVAIFQAIEKLGCNVATARGFVFCDGPGSILGIRTVAMALGTWNVLEARPVFAYSSLALVAHAIGRPELSIIADARRDAWHHYQIGVGLRRVPATDLRGALAMPEGFRNWSTLPMQTKSVPYSVGNLIPQAMDTDLFLETVAPDAFLHEEPNYVTWTPRIHQPPRAAGTT